MNTKERLLLFIKDTGITVSEFERKCSLSNGYIKKVKGSIGSDKIEDIIRAYPQLSRVWLLSGEANMFKSQANCIEDETIQKISGEFEIDENGYLKVKLLK